jgi:Mrp family chromosome partitioning ATPase
MERIQRALDLAKLQRGKTVESEDPRLERDALSREFALAQVESVARLKVNWAELKERRIISTDDVQHAGHAYRMLRTQILHRARAHGVTTLGIIGATNGEGKTLTAINLAISLAAEPNQTVMLVDLDLRRPSVARMLGLTVDRGLESWFGGDEPTKNVCYSIEGNERLYVLPTLAPLVASSEILASMSARRLIHELKDRDPGRLLIIDLPPVLLSDDVLAISPLLDGVVLVVNERRTRREDIVRVVELLGNTKVVGTVLNRASEFEKRTY